MTRNLNEIVSFWIRLLEKSQERMLISSCHISQMSALQHAFYMLFCRLTWLTISDVRLHRQVEHAMQREERIRERQASYCGIVEWECVGRCEPNKTTAKSVWAPSYFFRTFILSFLIFFVFRSKEKLDAYLLTTQVCRWFRFAQLAKGKKSRP